MSLRLIPQTRSKYDIFHGTEILDFEDTPWGTHTEESRLGYFYYCEELRRYYGPYPTLDEAIYLGDKHYNALDSL